ncbi:MAG: DNA-3-methyladenine glycosylase family protein [Planctomycetota bacterium]|jgi:3-methyladenine DNA glycosylase/8-oxoguanine DNA glycosylase
MTPPTPQPTRPSQAQLATLRRADERMAALMDVAIPYPGFPLAAQARASHYESLAHSIVFQQLSGKAASTIWSRACGLSDKRGFPRAEELLDLSDDVLREAGLSRQKVAALRDLASHVVDHRLDLRNIGRMEDSEIVEHLTAVRGIGDWSAQMFMIFKLGRLDVMATGDLGLQEGLRRLDGLQVRPTPSELLDRSEAWAPLRSVASWYLWRATELADDAFPQHLASA